ncbi:MAG: tol-pal system YbgF family protein [Bdellovibrionales bacterium]
MKLILISLSALLSFGCASSPSKSQNKDRKSVIGSEKKVNQSRAKKLAKRLKRQNQLVRQLKEENSILKKRLSTKSLLQSDQPATSKASSSSKRKNDFLGTGGEAKLFGTFVDFFSGQHFEKAYKALSLLEKAYPKSNYIPEAYYIVGKKHLENKRFKKALRSFDKVLMNYPENSRARTAMLGKAITYRRMKLDRPALSVLEQVIKQYPKTVEAEKAQLHKNLISKGSL